MTISYFKEYLPLFESLYQRHDEYFADFTVETSILLDRELGFALSRFLCSSELSNLERQKTDRVISVLKKTGAKYYICRPLTSLLYGAR
ncbi:MAG: WbqC family protein [Anaerolineae bacterium]|nr:WbqC family protein [Anaerolineae bacterium]